MELLILIGLIVGVISSLNASKDNTTEDTDSEENGLYDETDPLFYEMLEESAGEDFF